MFEVDHRSIDDSFYRTARWKKCRAAFIASRQSIDGGLCQRCGERMGVIVHHRIHLTTETVNDPDVAYGFGNLELVCLDCHNIEHGFKPEPIPGATLYAFDEAGNPVPTGQAPR